MTSTRLRSARIVSAAGVVAAVVLFVCGNVLVHRFYARWDATSAKLYSLSAVSLEMLHRLDGPVEVLVLLAGNDPVTPSARQLLNTYEAHSPWLRSRFIDPDKDPAELAAVQSKYSSANASLAEAGVALLVVKGQRSWRVGLEDLTVYDQDEGRVQPRLEQAITSAIRNVIEHKEAEVCFSRGHQEASIDSGGSEGLAAFRDSLERNNFQVSEVDFGPLAKPPNLEHCQALIMAGPRVAVPSNVATRIEEYFRNRGHLLLILPPTLTETGAVATTGLEPVLAAAGIDASRQIVLETRSELVLPLGIGGDVFLATPKSHELTRLFAHSAEVQHRVLMQMPQSFRIETSSVASAVLVSSERSRAVTDPGRLLDPTIVQAVLSAGTPGEHILAVAAQLASPSQEGGSRLVVVGSLAPFVDTSLREAGHYGSRLFVDSVMGWLAGGPALIDIPEKPAHEATLNLTEDSLTEVNRYVLLYMPGTAVLVALIILLKRRATEKSSRNTAGERS
jgi:hypothetical protein